MSAARIRGAVRGALGGRRVSSLSVAIVDDATIASLHERFLDDPSPTDVLTFDLRDDEDDSAIEGEIVVSADTARRQGGSYGRPPHEEVLRYVIHGVLHLTGLDDGTAAQRKRMRREEDRVLAGLDPRPEAERAGRRRTGRGV